MLDIFVTRGPKMPFLTHFGSQSVSITILMLISCFEPTGGPQMPPTTPCVPSRPTRVAYFGHQRAEKAIFGYFDLTTAPRCGLPEGETNNFTLGASYPPWAKLIRFATSISHIFTTRGSKTADFCPYWVSECIQTILT